MSTTYSKLLTDILSALGDHSATTWSRTDIIEPWAEEAMLAFPILRPMHDDHTNGGLIQYSYAAPADFKEVVSIEYPINQQPPVYLTRKNHLDPNFFREAGFYDIDHDYVSGSGWIVYVSGGITAGAHIEMDYLASHVIGLADNYSDLITVPDEYENILIMYCVARAYRERLGLAIQDPTAHTSVIQQMTEMVKRAEEHYNLLVKAAQDHLTNSKISPRLAADKYDRLY